MDWRSFEPQAALMTVALAAGGAAGCAASAPATPLSPTTVQLPAPARSIHLRVAFDADPSIYVGRFLPDGLRPEAIDENAAVATRCSAHVKARVVEARQAVDETMYTSRSAGISLGLPAVAAGVSANQSSSNTVRVRYEIVRKIQPDIDADGLARCCRDDPSQCSQRMIGEFVMGSGAVMQSTSEQHELGASGQLPHTPALAAGTNGENRWKTVSTFENVYFAFLVSAAFQPLGAGSSVGTTSEGDCGWCENLPRSLDGKYFCGVSPDAATEALARDLAMRNAREQAVRYARESVESTSSSRATSARGLVEDEQTVRTAASGIAARVKDERWCKSERVPTPAGERIRSKVLAFVAKSDLDALAAPPATAAPSPATAAPSPATAAPSPATAAPSSATAAPSSTAKPLSPSRPSSTPSAAQKPKSSARPGSEREVTGNGQ